MGLMNFMDCGQQAWEVLLSMTAVKFQINCSFLLIGRIILVTCEMIEETVGTASRS